VAFNLGTEAASNRLSRGRFPPWAGSLPRFFTLCVVWTPDAGAGSPGSRTAEARRRSLRSRRGTPSTRQGLAPLGQSDGEERLEGLRGPVGCVAKGLGPSQPRESPPASHPARRLVKGASSPAGPGAVSANLTEAWSAKLAKALNSLKNNDMLD
jgi:hypothetical protein